MDSKALLDYALFQLTPTRTRCDLVVFSGKKSEKLKSGLVEPFLAHLKYAKDHIPKGGYSITLRPPATCDDASWFTKATFQRFVRFVSTPEILERIIRVEKEILQIESSIQSSEIPNMGETGDPAEEGLSVADKSMKSSNSSKLTAGEEDQRAALRENSRLRLQRLMDTRKALLQKEQAMAYARAVVAGYEMDTIDDLICFADAFGASRLRVACIDFKELYKKKHSDDIWMDELAAVQASPMTDLSYMGTSGIVLTGENINGNGISPTPLVRTSSSDSTPTSENNFPAPEQTPNVQQQVPWMNQIPPYMYNFQGPMQQIPPYQGYPYPSMPYYPGHMGWSPPGGIVPAKHHKSSRRKEKSLNENETDDSAEEDEQTVSGDSDTGTDLDEDKKEHDKKPSSKGQKHGKRNKKKASKTVVIRNINYITSQRHNGEEDNGISEDFSGESSSIGEGVDNAIASLEKHAHSKARKSRDIDGNISEGGKGSNNAWDAFQNILMSNEESNSKDSMDEHFVMENSNGGLSHKTSNVFDLESEKIKMRSLTIDDSVLAIQRGMENGGKADVVGFTNAQDMPPSMKRPLSQDESALFTQQFEGPRTNTIADFSSESSTVKIRKGEDWFIVNSSGGSLTHDGKQSELLAYERDFAKKETARGNAVVDDSFMIESRSAADDVYASHWRTDISMDADIDVPSKPENGVPAGVSGSLESDELCMVLVRESRESNASWTPELDYEVEISFSESNIKKSSPVVEEPVASGTKNADPKKNGSPATKTLRRGEKTKTPSGGSLSKSRLDSLSKSKTVSSTTSRLMMHKGGKLAKEEEERKRMEALLIERQKRIAERTAARDGGLASKKLPVANKSSATPKKLSQHKFPAKLAA